MRGIKLVFAFFFISIFLFLAGGILFLISCPMVNDASAKEVVKDILSLPLPEGAKVAEEFAQAGKLEGNGNGMQFFGAILIKSDSSLEEIEEHYSLYREKEWNYIVEVQEKQQIRAIEHGEASLETDVSEGGYYIVYSWGNGRSPFQYFDLRGY